MLGLICSLALLGQVEGSVVQKELPNGAKFRIEATPGSGTLMIALYASEAGLPNDGGVPGTRHLLEHLIAKGGDRLLDTKLESVGLSLTAFTERDGTAFVVMGSSRQSVLGIESLRDLLEPLRVDSEELAIELKILEQESALRADYEPFLDRAWLELFEPGVGSVFGDLKAVAQLTPDQLMGGAEALMSSGGLTVYVRGDVDADVTALRLTEVLNSATRGQVNFAPRGVLESIGRKETVAGKGRARAVVAAGLDRPMTLARLGVALAIMRLEPGFEVVYEPSFDRGPVLLYSRSGDGFGALEKYDQAGLSRFAALARLQAVRLMNGWKLEGPRFGVLRAKKLRQASAFNLDQLESTARGLTDDEIWSALQDWRGGAMHLEGTQ